MFIVQKIETMQRLKENYFNLSSKNTRRKDERMG